MKLKLLYPPKKPISVVTGENIKYHSLPPIGISMLTSFLNERGFKVEQDDLMIKTIRGDKKIDLEPFCDDKRIEKFIETGDDTKLIEEGEKILNLTNLRGVDVVGFSIFEGFNSSSSSIPLVLSKILKRKKDVTIIAGGSIQRRIIRKLLREGDIDYFIFGTDNCMNSAEINLLYFCELFEKGKLNNKKKLTGALCFDGENFIDGEIYHEEIPIPRPSFDGLPLDLYKEKASDSNDMLILPYMFIRGCPYSCAFCSKSIGKKWTTKKPEEVVTDLQHLSKKYDTNYFFFLNPEINPTKSYANKVAEGIIDSNLDIYWTDCISFQNTDKETLQKLKKAGASRLIFGLESASKKILNYINKPITSVKQTERILDFACENDIATGVEFIVGFPYETKKDIEKTIDYIKRKGDKIHFNDLFKFWLDGSIKKYPNDFNIKIEDDIDTEEKLAVDKNLTAFSETKGRNWKEILKMSEKHHDLIKDAIDEHILSQKTKIKFDKAQKDFLEIIESRWADYETVDFK